jgi:hypothetical protein
MDSAPDAPPTAATVFTSLWQENLVGYRIERTLSWFILSNGVQWLAGA